MLGGKGLVGSKGRALAAIMLCLLPMLLLGSCRRSTPTPEPVTISFACLDEDLGYYEGLARAFNASHPNIRVKLLPRRQLALQVLAPSESDTFVVSLPLEPYLERGGLLSADERLANKDDFYPCALAAFTLQGKTWAIPTGVDPMLMYYNRDLFDARQIPYPQTGWTWEQFLEAALKLRDWRQGIYGYGAGLGPHEPLLFVLQNGGRLADDWHNPTQATFEDPQTVQAMDWYARLIFQHDVAPNAYEVKEAFGSRGVYGAILDGRIGMWAAYYSARLDPVGQSQVNWSTTSLPRGSQEATLADVEGVAVSAQTAHPELCWQWADFLSRQVPGRMAPVRRSVAHSPAFSQRAGAEMASAVKHALEHALVLPQAPMGFYQKLNGLWTQAIDDIANGRMDALHALRHAQQQAGR